MVVLITGAGLIGTWTARQLVAEGHAVVLYDTAPDTNAIGSVVGTDRFSIVRGDVCDLPALRTAIERHGVTEVLHTAAVLTIGAKENPSTAARTNVLGTTTVLDAARAAQCRRVVVASSATISFTACDEQQGVPAAEDFSMRLLSQRPRSVYSATKIAAEHLTYIYGDSFGLDAIVLRYGAVLGDWSGPNHSLPGRFLRALAWPAMRKEPAVIEEPAFVWRGGEEFIDVRDCARANVLALAAAPGRNRTYTISSGRMSTFDDCVAGTRRVFPGLEVDVRCEPSKGFGGYPLTRHTPFDVGAAKRGLGFEVRHDFEDSVRVFSGFRSLAP